MSEQHDLIFDTPTVIVSGYREAETAIHEACEAIFGRRLTPEDFVELICAPDGSELLIEARQGDESVELQLGYEWFDGTHDYLIYVEEDVKVVEIVGVKVKAEAPDLLETRLFTCQARSFQRFGINQIRLFAAGYPADPSGYIGYYFWPRVGFVIYFGGLSAEMAGAGFRVTDNTLDLFTQEGGRSGGETTAGKATPFSTSMKLGRASRLYRLILMRKGSGRMAKTGKKVCVVHVAPDALKYKEAASVVAPRYDPERDEPAFDRAWDRIADMKVAGELKAVPPAPAEGIRLRGKGPK